MSNAGQGGAEGNIVCLGHRELLMFLSLGVPLLASVSLILHCSLPPFSVILPSFHVPPHLIYCLCLLSLRSYCLLSLPLSVTLSLFFFGVFSSHSQLSFFPSYFFLILLVISVCFLYVPSFLSISHPDLPLTSSCRSVFLLSSFFSSSFPPPAFPSLPPNHPLFFLSLLFLLSLLPGNTYLLFPLISFSLFYTFSFFLSL